MMETTRILKDFYVIALTISRPLSTRRPGDGPVEVFFKADRYSPYSGRLQVEWEAEHAQQFKTEKGARAAIDRLLAKQTIKDEQKPRVVRYTETVSQRWETLEPVCAEVTA